MVCSSFQSSGGSPQPLPIPAQQRGSGPGWGGGKATGRRSVFQSRQGWGPVSVRAALLPSAAKAECASHGDSQHRNPDFAPWKARSCCWRAASFLPLAFSRGIWAVPLACLHSPALWFVPRGHLLRPVTQAPRAGRLPAAAGRTVGGRGGLGCPALHPWGDITCAADAWRLPLQELPRKRFHLGAVLLVAGTRCRWQGDF